MVNFHTDCPNMLNNSCGADYAKFTGQPSREMQSYSCNEILQPCNSKTHVRDVNLLYNTHFYCLDGDADRLIGFCRTKCDHNTKIDSHNEDVNTVTFGNNDNDDNADKIIELT